MASWYLFLEPCQIIYHADIGMFIRKLTEQGLSTLLNEMILLMEVQNMPLLSKVSMC